MEDHDSQRLWAQDKKRVCKSKQSIFFLSDTQLYFKKSTNLLENLQQNNYLKTYCCLYSVKYNGQSFCYAYLASITTPVERQNVHNQNNMLVTNYWLLFMQSNCLSCLH